MHTTLGALRGRGQRESAVSEKARSARGRGQREGAVNDDELHTVTREGDRQGPGRKTGRSAARQPFVSRAPYGRGVRMNASWRTLESSPLPSANGTCAPGLPPLSMNRLPVVCSRAAVPRPALSRLSLPRRALSRRALPPRALPNGFSVLSAKRPRRIISAGRVGRAVRHPFTERCPARSAAESMRLAERRGVSEADRLTRFAEGRDTADRCGATARTTPAVT